MQKLISSLKTLSSRQSPNFSTNLFSTSSRSVPSPAFVQRLRSCKFASTTGDFKAITMASSATGKLPAEIEDGLGKKYWRKFKKEWTEALYTPFVIALAAGNLKLDTFRDYIAQDVYFLRAFVKALVILTSVCLFDLHFVFLCFFVVEFLISFFCVLC